MRKATFHVNQERSHHLNCEFTHVSVQMHGLKKEYTGPDYLFVYSHGSRFQVDFQNEAGDVIIYDTEEEAIAGCVQYMLEVRAKDEE